MLTSLLSDAYAHHVWATIRQLDACAALDEAQLATTVPGTYGSILDTLRHVVDGDVFYLNILRGGEPEPFDKDACDIPTLRAVMVAHGPLWQELLAGYEGADPAADPATDVVEYEDNGYETHAPLGVRLGQVLYHGTDHRSQVNTALTTLGIEPPAIEGWDIARDDGRMYTIPTPQG
ncbi:MAG: DinB family protein [Chloroflexi bacterium]|nr:DinB family protein [Chloroflexota bacterium]